MSSESTYAEIPVSDSELLRRAKYNSVGFVDALECEEITQSERIYVLSRFLVREQRRYQNPSQIKRIIERLGASVPESDTEIDKVVQDAFESQRTRRHRVLQTAPQDWEDPLWARRRQLEDDVVGRHLVEGGIRIVPDQPGVGKTTSPSRGLLGRNVRHFLAVERHEKAVDHKNKRVITEKGSYFHRKGVSQPRFDCCIQKGNCEHDSENPPLMCPIYERSENDPVRQEFTRQERIRSHKRAHEAVDGASDRCTWLDHMTELEEQDPDFVIGVHQHLTHFSDWDTVLVDETPKMTTFQDRWTTADLGRAAALLYEIPNGAWLAEWVETLRNDIINADLHQVSIRVDAPHHAVNAEELTELKWEYNELVLSEGEIPGISQRTQPCFDAILGSLVEVGFKPTECRKAIDARNTLERCPWCDAPVKDGFCHGDQCLWNRYDHSLLPRGVSSPRVCCYMDGDELVYTEIPDTKDLPDSVLLTDATPRPKLVSAFFGVPEEEFWYEVGPEFDLNAHTTELINGQYHASTISGSEILRERIQRAIEKVDRNHDKVLYTLKSNLKDHFEFPKDCIVRHYGNVKGIDITEVDAVVMIGAQHIHVEQARHIAEALTLDNPDIEVGGEEVTETRTVTVDGEDIEVETKAYAGLVGEIFKSSREDEFVQDAHRPRPIIASNEITIIKISNVPTPLPIDERLTWAEFLNEGLPFRAMHEFVHPLCKSVEADEVELTTPELKQLASDNMSDRSVEVWVNRLVDIGLAEKVLNIDDLRTNRYRIDISALRDIG